MTDTDRTTLGDRMKAYEAVSTERRAFRGQPLIARLDGKSFHQFTKGLRRPYDSRLSELMRETMVALTDRFACRVAYTQSDEITLMWYEAPDATPDYPYRGRFQKLESLLAGFASAFFNKHLAFHLPEKADLLPHFDCRAFVVPTLLEAYHEFLWRQQDAVKNAISMAAQSMFSHKSLQGLHGPQMQERMWKEKGVNFNEYPSFFKRGVFARRVKVFKPIDEDLKTRLVAKGIMLPTAPIERSVIESVDIWLSKQLDPVQTLFFGGEITPAPEVPAPD